MGFRAYLFTYVFGGLTFLPLLIAAIVIPAWYLLPQAESASVDGDDLSKDDKSHSDAQKIKSKELSADAAAGGTFAVLRRYDFQAAMAALNARNNGTPNPATGASGVDGGVPGDGIANGTNESVYQSMYRSVFVGNKNNSSTSSLLQSDNTENSPQRKKFPSANVLYIVLRHGHLMLYDSPAQVEVKHVLSLAQYSVTLQAGPDEDEESAERNIMEADLFTKRTAIVLTPIELPNGALQAPVLSVARPFYLFMATNIDKEDFYHALLSTRSRPPMPQSLDPDALIKLQSTLHASSLTQETRALNALIGRVFVALHHTDTLSNFVRGKLERKLNRIQKPTFIPSLRVQSIDLGDAGPAFSNLKLRDFDITGDMSLTADMKYNGGLSVTLLAVAKLDLGSRFKVRTVDLLLKTTLRRISGTMLLRIKPSPSNRLWFCFDSMPDLDVRVEPVVSERKITYGFVLRAIEERVRTAFAEGLVKPNFDDVPMPFSDSRGGHVRGGLWSDLGEHDHAKARQPPATPLSERNEKAVSMPSFPQGVDSGVSSGLASTSDVNLAKLRHASTMPMDASPDRSPRPPRPLRTPSVSSSSVAVDGLNVEPVRADDAGIRPAQPKRLWRARGAATPQSQKDALEELRGVQSRAEQAAMPAATSAADSSEASRRRSTLSDDELSAGADDGESLSSRISANSTASIGAPTLRSSSMRSTESDQSRAAPSIASSRTDQAQSRKANILAATVNATNAAKNWSWNAIQRRATTRQDAQMTQEPMGRGQPLPPPGQPLPGPPQKGIWGSVGTMKRKPVANATIRERQHSALSQTSTGDGRSSKQQYAAPSDNEEGIKEVEDEFQAWQENTGAGSASKSRPVSASGSEALIELNKGDASPKRSSIASGKDSPRINPKDVDAPSVGGDDARSITSRRLPPPLPARPKRHDGLSGVSTPDGPASSASSLKLAAEDDVSNAPALRVPDAAAQAIADENSKTNGSTEDVVVANIDSEYETKREHHDKADKDARLEAEGAVPIDFAHAAQSSSAQPAGKEAHAPERTAGIYCEQAPGSAKSVSKDSGAPAHTTAAFTDDEDEILSRVRARIKERTPTVGKDKLATEEDFLP